MLKNILNLEGTTQLSKSQQSQILGGFHHGSDCKIFVRLEDGTSYWSSQAYTVAEAQEYYATGGDALYSGFSVTGYCCASCA